MKDKKKKVKSAKAKKVTWAVVSVLLAGLFGTITVLANGMLEPILQTVLGSPMLSLTTASILSILPIMTPKQNPKKQATN